MHRLNRHWLRIHPGLKARLRGALREDGAFRDITTLAVIQPDVRAEGVMVAKETCILAGLPVAAFLFQDLDRCCRFIPLKKEGALVRKGTVVARVMGRARALLSAERVALNFLSRLSGIATLTRRFVERVGKNRIYDTRKTTPLWRELERYAVRVGGGMNHRYNLSEALLIKDNHLAVAGGITRTVQAIRKKHGSRIILEVEVESLRQVREALAAGVDIILIDNARPSLLRKAVRLARRKTVLEASGGLGLGKIGRIKHIPITRFSVGALTHSAPAVDFSLDLTPR